MGFKKSVVCLKVWYKMAIAPINSVNVISTKPVENKKVSNPITSEKPEVQQKASEQGALKSYFLGGQAATVSFGGFPVSTGGFITKKIDDVPCCCCGGRMVRNNQMGAKAAEFANINGEKLANKIEADKDFFRTPQRVVMMLAAEEARKNPSYDLAQAKNAIGNGLQKKTQDYCINSLKAADAAVKATYGENNPTSKLIARQIEELDSGKINRRNFTDKLVKQQGNLDPITYEKVMDAAMNIPKDFSEVRKAYGQANGSSQGIARALLKQSMQTIEHIHPKSKGGPNATENFIAECGDCNWPRGNSSYMSWLKVHPEYPIKAQHHIEWFQQQIVDGNIGSEYDDYGIDVKQTLSKETNGQINLKVLTPEKINELREARQAGKEVNVQEEIAKQEQEQEEA